ncbi:LysR family transcriptional regulator [Frateuria soli]|uniref:LysR family transcriptional regulator n=1 Tax=Frateuria soli TaxID=1542730 RepID=UPI001E303729|nr:LysR family transcriptional regulator [Frateuria soli]UGB39546.1 LysR family transcriptional regulator [Frateuria soli]
MAALNYNHLRYFWEVAREGNLTRTAGKLLISQSALSIQIRKLENQLGHDLFERSGRQLLLTEAGRIAFDHAEAIFSGGEELLATLRHRSDGHRSILRVGALATLSRNFQIGFLRPLLGRPDVEVVVRSGTTAFLLQGLEAHRLDVVLVNVPPPRDAATSWVAHEIAGQPVSLIGTPERIGKGDTLDRLLASHPLVLPTMESSVRIGFEALVDRLGVHVRVAAEVDDMAMMRLLAREDIGLAVVPPIVVKDELASGRLVEAHQLPQLSETFFAVTMKRRFPNPLLHDLLQPRAALDLAE